MIRLPCDPTLVTAERALVDILEHLADAVETGAGELRIRLDKNFSPRWRLSEGIAMKVEFGVAYTTMIVPTSSNPWSKRSGSDPPVVFRAAADLARRILRDGALRWELLADRSHDLGEANNGNSR